MTTFDVVRYVRKTDKPGVFQNGIGLEEMRAGDVTYIVTNGELSYRHCTREPGGVWVADNDPAHWLSDKEQTAVPYDWFEDMQ
jgi:hypothetical protein